MSLIDFAMIHDLTVTLTTCIDTGDKIIECFSTKFNFGVKYSFTKFEIENVEFGFIESQIIKWIKESMPIE